MKTFWNIIKAILIVVCGIALFCGAGIFVAIGAGISIIGIAVWVVYCLLSNDDEEFT